MSYEFLRLTVHPNKVIIEATIQHLWYAEYYAKDITDIISSKLATTIAHLDARCPISQIIRWVQRVSEKNIASLTGSQVPSWGPSDTSHHLPSHKLGKIRASAPLSPDTTFSMCPRSSVSQQENSSDLEPSVWHVPWLHQTCFGKSSRQMYTLS